MFSPIEKPERKIPETEPPPEQMTKDLHEQGSEEFIALTLEIDSRSSARPTMAELSEGESWEKQRGSTERTRRRDVMAGGVCRPRWRFSGGILPPPAMGGKGV